MEGRGQHEEQSNGVQQGVILERGERDWERDFSKQGLNSLCVLKESMESSTLQDPGNQQVGDTEKAAEYSHHPSSGLPS